MSEAQARQIERVTEAVLSALGGAGNDVTIAVGAIGAALGCLAATNPHPADTIARALAIANGIASGDLVDPA